jgi:diguanylate cyclase (GGDEF)-like protein
MTDDHWFQHLSAALSHSGAVAYIWHASDDRYEWAGDIHQVLGISDQPLSNAQLNNFINPQSLPQRMSALHDAMNQQAVGASLPQFAVKYKMRRGNGTQVDVEETATIHHDAEGRRTVRGFLRTLEKGDLTPTQSAGWQNLAALPGSGMTHNGRMMLQHRIESWMDEASDAFNATAYLLVVDLDRLSLINDAYGARFADELIEKTGQRLKMLVEGSGYVARIDGDVFGIFFGHAPYNEMAAVSKHILKNFFDVPIETSKGPMAVSVSIGGAAVSSKDREDPATLLTKAEMAVRAAKDRGRSCFVSYHEAAQQASENRQLLEHADTFLRALKDDRVKLAFQPIVDSRTSRISFHECLMRMIGEDGKLHSAGQFIPAVEKMGLSRLVDQYALRIAIQELSLFPDLQLSVNVSTLTLVDQDWLRGLVAMLRDRPSVARRLIVEVTESCVIHDMDKALRVVRTIQDLGARVALDDFGAGYTAFAQIKQLDVDLVKIDKQFIRNIGQSENHLFVKTLQSLADGVEIETVGEGVETMSDAKMLMRDGINHIQGYAFGFPSVERVWLPKDHIYRKIVKEENTGLSKAIADNHREQTASDIHGYRKRQ